MAENIFCQEGTVICTWAKVVWISVNWEVGEVQWAASNIVALQRGMGTLT